MLFLDSLGTWFFSSTKVSLRTKTTFLAKNPIPGHDLSPFMVKALTPFTGKGSKDRLLCPIRMLKYYLKYTSNCDKNGPLLRFRGKAIQSRLRSRLG